MNTVPSPEVVDATRLTCHLVSFTYTPAQAYDAALGYLEAACLADPAVAATWRLQGHSPYQSAEDEGAASEQLLASLVAPDVVAFSIYFWNEEVSLGCAARVKQRWPHALVVFGGVNVTNALFDASPAVDVIVHGEGEVALPRLLTAVASGGTLDGIPGVAHRTSDGWSATPPEVIADLDSIPSPYLTGVATPEKLSRTSIIVYETNRGCPYHCAFCCWGGPTNQRVRHFSVDRVSRELDVIIRHVRQGAVLFVTDANFGMFERDLLIAQEIVRLCRAYDKHIIIVTDWAKNPGPRVLDIAEMLHEAGLLNSITLAVQSFNEKTLQIARRTNIKLSRYRELQRQCIDRRITTYTDMIWGMPGDTYASFKAGIEECLDSGGSPMVFPLILLNNTAYSQPEYMDTYHMRVRRMPVDLSNPHACGPLVVEHSTMTEQDWIRGLRLRFGLALFFKLLFRATLSYLHAMGGVPFTDVIERLSDRLFDDGYGDKVLQMLVADYGEMIVHPGFESVRRARDIVNTEDMLEELHYQAVAKRLILNEGGATALIAMNALLRETAESLGDLVPAAGLETCLALDRMAQLTVRTHLAPPSPEPPAIVLDTALVDLFVSRGLIDPSVRELARPVVASPGDLRPGFGFSSYVVMTWHASEHPLRDVVYRSAPSPTAANLD
jgi:hypothetical protein